ncbi:hypothetical protein RvY_16237 [Ramazzottius varieornatus]|uniref:Uncharacterized protein n=1 Tax=Ramazzottius varieornatus TaxID=947166 RepID=A0A1D1VXR1_RAMVA|nr:hypothetical protein RvY_16237 [Ramazzottius varieornatus]
MAISDAAKRGDKGYNLLVGNCNPAAKNILAPLRDGLQKTALGGPRDKVHFNCWQYGQQYKKELEGQKPCQSFREPLTMSSSFGGKVNRTQAVTDQAEMDRIHALRIIKMERVCRPLSVGSAVASHLLSEVGGKHGGVKVTTSTGEQFPIHKGDKFGGEWGNTVAVPVAEMGTGWTTMASKEMGNSQMTISDAIRKGGENYNLLFENCNHAADSLFRQ